MQFNVLGLNSAVYPLMDKVNKLIFHLAML